MVDIYQDKQQTGYLIIEYQRYITEQKAIKIALLKKGFSLTIQILFCTKIGKKVFVKFLINTNIYTSQWYTNAGYTGE